MKAFIIKNKIGADMTSAPPLHQLADQKRFSINWHCTPIENVGSVPEEQFHSMVLAVESTGHYVMFEHTNEHDH